MLESDNIIQKKSFDFALLIIELYKILNKNNEFILSKQLLRSGTSIGANIEEALQAQSKADFISKLSISLKEGVETRYWLKLLKESKIVEYNFNEYILKVNEIINILTKIIKTSKSK